MIVKANPDDQRARGIAYEQIAKGIIPTTATKEFEQDGWLRELNLVNPGSSVITVSIYDGDNIFLIPGIPLGPNGMISYNGSRWMTNGVIWVASAPGISGYMRFLPS